MFTLEAIRERHSQVKSGADFPAYIKDLSTMGILSYQAYVSDGRINYQGTNNYTVNAPAKYDVLQVADLCNPEQFKADLKKHQQGGSTYLEFCSDCAASGIEKWEVLFSAMTCTYYDKAGNEVFLEEIPV